MKQKKTHRPPFVCFVKSKVQIKSPSAFAGCTLGVRGRNLDKCYNCKCNVGLGIFNSIVQGLQHYTNAAKQRWTEFITQQRKNVIYLAGKMTGNPNYREQFNAAADELTKAGFIVLNPASHPEGLTYEAYMRIDTAMINECEGICLLPGWLESRGATYEKHRAEILGLNVFYFEEWQRDKVVNGWINKN